MPNAIQVPLPSGGTSQQHPELVVRLRADTIGPHLEMSERLKLKFKVRSLGVGVGVGVGLEVCLTSYTCCEVYLLRRRTLTLAQTLTLTL